MKTDHTKDYDIFRHQLDDICSGDTEFMVQFVQLFEKNLNEALLQLEHANRDQSRKISHRLKTNFGIFRLKNAQTAAKALERVEQKEELIPLQKELVSEIRKVQSFIASVREDFHE